MFYFIKIIISWLFSSKSLSAIIFVSKSIQTIFKNSENKKIIEKIASLTTYLDNINSVLPNETTNQIAEKINSDQQHFAGFSAEIVTDKHGHGNNGIAIGFRNKNIDISYDPTDGSVKVSLNIIL